MDNHIVVITEINGGYYAVIDPDIRNATIDLFNYTSLKKLCRELPKTIDIIKNELD